MISDFLAIGATILAILAIGLLLFLIIGCPVLLIMYKAQKMKSGRMKKQPTSMHYKWRKINEKN